MSDRLSLLTGEEADLLRAQPFAYPEVSGTRVDLPAGYHHLKRARIVGTGRATFNSQPADEVSWPFWSRGSEGDGRALLGRRHEIAVDHCHLATVIYRANDLRRSRSA